MAPLDELYTIQSSAGYTRILRLNPETAEVTPALDLNPSGPFGPNALAFSPTGQIVGYNGPTRSLIEIDPKTGDVERVGGLGTSVPGLAFVDGDTLYGVDTGNDQLLRIDPATAETTAVGPFGTNLKHVGLAVDFDTLDLYTIGGKEDGQTDMLYRVSKEDGALTAVGRTGIDINSVGVEFVPANGEIYSLRGSQTDTTVLRKLDLESGVGIQIGSVPVGGLANLGTPWPGAEITAPAPADPATPIPDTGQTPVGRKTPVDPSEYRLRDGSVMEVDVGYDSYYVITDIPNATPGTYAVTTTTYELVNTEIAHDALITAVWKEAGGSGIDWQQTLKTAKQRATKFQALELLSRAVDLGVDALQTYALAQVSPSLALGPAVDLFFESINWTVQEATDPYKEGFGKITRTVRECRDFDQMADRIDSRTEFTSLMNTSVDLAMTLDDIAKGGASMAKAFAKASSRTAGITKAVTAYGAKKAAASIFIGFAIDTIVEQLIDGAMEANAKLMAAGHAYEVAKMTLSKRIIGLELRREDAALPPGGVVALVRMKAAYFQIGALLGYLIEKYYTAMHELWSGPLWDIVADAGEMARRGREIAQGAETAAYWTWRVLGFGMKEAKQRLDGSVNSRLEGTST